jgi:hypothetical protein
VEPADVAVLGAILIQESEMRLVEFSEELVPFNSVEAFILRAEINPQDSGLSIRFRRFHGCRPPSPICRPFPDSIVVRRGVTFAHSSLRGSLDPARIERCVWKATQQRPVRSYLRRPSFFFIFIFIFFRNVPARRQKILSCINLFRR